MITDVKDRVIGVSLQAYNGDDLLLVCFRIESKDDLVAAAQRLFALGNAVETPHLARSIRVKKMLTPAAVATNGDPHADEIVQGDTVSLQVK